MVAKKDQIAYFGISKSNRVNFDTVIDVTRKCLKTYHVDLEVFVDKYEFRLGQEKEMMKIAFDELDKCDILIVELTKKAIGVGVEVGYAKARNKPIIYVKKQNSKYSTTVGGSSDYTIEYKDENHLERELNKVMKILVGKKNRTANE